MTIKDEYHQLREAVDELLAVTFAPLESLAQRALDWLLVVVIRGK